MPNKKIANRKILSRKIEVSNNGPTKNPEVQELKIKHPCAIISKYH